MINLNSRTSWLCSKLAQSLRKLVNGMVNSSILIVDGIWSSKVTEDKKITEAGKAVLWFTDNGPDPTPGKTYVEFTMPLRDKMND